jgi:hypothetical protein
MWRSCRWTIGNTFETRGGKSLSVFSASAASAASACGRPGDQRGIRSGLERIATFIAARKRMEFWQQVDKDHEWIAAPGRQAKNFLHVYLQARFGDRVEIFDELAAGAGRIDLYVRLAAAYRSLPN